MVQHKWLPSEPTAEMLNAAMSNLPLSMPEIQAKQIYSLLWNAAETNQEPNRYFTETSNHPSLNEDDISRLIYWVHRLYAEIPDKKENYTLFDEVNTSGVLMIDHFYDRLPKESE